MIAAHTPGPWKIDAGNWIWGPDGFPIAACDQGAFDHNRAGECCANADLIAAAPELLAALQAVADYWAGGDAPADIDAQIRAAIARAGGAP
jgi:hypothetical protein